jgi:hypothetical protein
MSTPDPAPPNALPPLGSNAGPTVDALVTRLEKLMEEGMDSGPPIEANDEFWREMEAAFLLRATHRARFADSAPGRSSLVEPRRAA